jgi:hypothetical protein
VFNHFVRVVGYPKPKAGFATKHDAMVYAVWASKHVPHVLELYYSDGDRADEPTDRYQKGRRL